MCWLSRYVLSLLLELECDKTNDTCFKHLLYLIVYDAINRILIGTSRPFKLWHCRVLKQRLMKKKWKINGINVSWSKTYLCPHMDWVAILI